MIAEQRDSKLDESELMNALQAYLRQEFSDQSLHNRRVYDAAYERLLLKIEDWAYRHDCYEIAKQRKYDIATEALKRFADNWDGKTPGEDDRGHRFAQAMPLGGVFF